MSKVDATVNGGVIVLLQRLQCATGNTMMFEPRAASEAITSMLVRMCGNTDNVVCMPVTLPPHSAGQNVQQVCMSHCNTAVCWNQHVNLSKQQNTPMTTGRCNNKSLQRALKGSGTATHPWRMRSASPLDQLPSAPAWHCARLIFAHCLRKAGSVIRRG